MTPDEKERRRKRAEQILQDDLVLEAFNELKREYTAAMVESQERDTDGRENAYRYLRVLDKFEGHLKTVIETGRLSERAKKYIVQRRSGLFRS